MLSSTFIVHEQPNVAMHDTETSLLVSWSKSSPSRTSEAGYTGFQLLALEVLETGWHHSRSKTVMIRFLWSSLMPYKGYSQRERYDDTLIC